MPYQIAPQQGQTKRYMEPRRKCEIWYFSKKQLSARCSEQTFHVIGEIGGCARAPNQGDVLTTENGAQLPILPRGSLRWPLERIIGYALLTNGSYLAVVWSPLHWRSGRTKGRIEEEKKV